MVYEDHQVKNKRGKKYTVFCFAGKRFYIYICEVFTWGGEAGLIYTIVLVAGDCCRGGAHGDAHLSARVREPRAWSREASCSELLSVVAVSCCRKLVAVSCCLRPLHPVPSRPPSPWPAPPRLCLLCSATPLVFPDLSAALIFFLGASPWGRQQRRRGGATQHTSTY